MLLCVDFDKVFVGEPKLEVGGRRCSRCCIALFALREPGYKTPSRCRVEIEAFLGSKEFVETQKSYDRKIHGLIRKN